MSNTRRWLAERLSLDAPELAGLSWDADAEGWLIEERDGYAVWVAPLMFTAAVITGRVGSMGYDDRWCYADPLAAVHAARRWGGPWNGGEPDGWHRHPTSGRRREDGDPARETIML